MTFSSIASGFDAFARPSQTVRSSTLGFSQTETLVYHDNTTRWILGQVAKRTIVADGQTTVPSEVTVFNDWAQPLEIHQFGRRVQTLGYFDNTSPLKGLLNTYTDESGKTTTLTQYELGIPRRIEYHDNSFEEVTLWPRGEIKTHRSPTGGITSYTYDPMGRLSSITYPADPVGWHNTTIVFEPINSPTGEFGLPNKTWKRTVQTGDATGYAVSDTYYDTLWRPLLTREYDSADPTSLRVTRRAFDAGGRERYVSFPTRDAFDPTGNRTARVKDGATEQLSYTNTPATPVFPTDPTYADFSHRLQSVDATPRTYDDVGNTLTGIPELNAQNATSEYDERNRLTRIHSGGIELARYEYNGRGERVAKQTADEAYFYAYDESGQLIGRYVPEGATDLRIDEEILWLDSTPIASVRLDNGQPVIRGIHSDHLNSPRALTSLHGDTQPQGNSVWRWPLTTGEAAGNNAYGTEAPQEDPDGDGTAVVFHLRFPGQQYDGESGLHYNYFRDYEAGTGRYVESDPIGLRGGLATFSYAKQASLNQKDPTGEIAFHSSCDSTQRAMIMISLLEMMSMHWESCVSKPNCNACNCLLAGEAILALSRMNISCNLGYKCASTNGNTRQLWLHPDTARRIDEKPNRPDKCGCLAGTLLHEGMHAQDAYPEMFYEENLVRTEARRCVPCAGNFTESGGPLPR